MLQNRIKSFAWRVGMVCVAAFLSAASSNLGLLELNPEVTVVLGLILGEVSKWLNTR